MNKIIVILLTILVSLELNANQLTIEQLNKLKNPIVELKDKTYEIEEYNVINYKHKMSFFDKKISKVTIKTSATMKKDIIHKDYFLAITTSFYEQVLNSIFLTEQIINNVSSTEFLLIKPQKYDFLIKLEFMKKGFYTYLNNGKEEERNYIPYSQLFLNEIK